MSQHVAFSVLLVEEYFPSWNNIIKLYHSKFSFWLLRRLRSNQIYTFSLLSVNIKFAMVTLFFLCFYYWFDTNVTYLKYMQKEHSSRKWKDIRFLNYMLRYNFPQKEILFSVARHWFLCNLSHQNYRTFRVVSRYAHFR